MSGFTKGPWHIHWGLKYASIRNQEGVYVLEPTRSGSQVRYVADAHLIATAPEIYEALKGAQEELRLIRMKDTGAVYDPTIRVRIDAALAKAVQP